uniref:Uncharacterized protein n=1 Tax=Arundo donax TaxID=35708 RepID=A0A0A9C0P4_ARUDO
MMMSWEIIATAYCCILVYFC